MPVNLICRATAEPNKFALPLSVRDWTALTSGALSGVPADETSRLQKAQEVSHHIKSRIGVTCETVVKAVGEMPRSQGKAVRVKDLRKT